MERPTHRRLSAENFHLTLDPSLSTRAHWRCGDFFTQDNVPLLTAHLKPKPRNSFADDTHLKHKAPISEYCYVLKSGQYSLLPRDCAETQLESYNDSDQFHSTVAITDSITLTQQSVYDSLECVLHRTCLHISDFRESQNTQLVCSRSRKAPDTFHDKFSLKHFLLHLANTTDATRSSSGAASHTQHWQRHLADQTVPRLTSVFSIASSIVLLLTLLQPPIVMATNLGSSREFHPSQVLSSSSPVTTLAIPSESAGAADEVKEDEVS
ncbi:hypothetical protein ElyMa_002887500 [Elysia marginata]|uniref:Uncharacterized protein n=1 Tax=Elysia marginata TaxID=1093978 RepID=A0AAV4I382_9GAST|nr:hypothetical protein ElyMa_002887500 [Elysia marginata]